MMKIKKTGLAMNKNKNAKVRRRGARPVCFDGRFIGYTDKTFRELRAVARQARQSFKEEGSVLQGLQLLRKAHALMVGRRTQGHQNLRAAVARQKAKIGYYRELWHAACGAAERAATAATRANSIGDKTRPHPCPLPKGEGESLSAVGETNSTAVLSKRRKCFSLSQGERAG
jgi:hypothetical protein